jgi:hypothetical protein
MSEAGMGMQTHLWQLADVETRLRDAVRQLRQQQKLVVDLDCLQDRRSLALLLANGLRAYCWLEDQQNGLLERIGEDHPLPRQ